MKLNSKNTHYLLIGVLVLLIFSFLGVFIVGSSKLSKKSQQMVQLKVKNQIAQLQLANLEQTKKDVEKYAYFKTVAKTVIPADKNQAQTVLNILQNGDKTGIEIQKIEFPPSNLGAGAGSATVDATTPTATKNVISQAKPVTAVPGLYSLQLDITPVAGFDATPDNQVTYTKMINFLRSLENDRRTAQVSQIKIEAGASGFTLSINTFIKP